MPASEREVLRRPIDRHPHRRRRHPEALLAEVDSAILRAADGSVDPKQRRPTFEVVLRDFYVLANGFPGPPARLECARSGGERPGQNVAGPARLLFGPVGIPSVLTRLSSVPTSGPNPRSGSASESTHSWSATSRDTHRSSSRLFSLSGHWAKVTQVCAGSFVRRLRGPCGSVPAGRVDLDTTTNGTEPDH